MNGRWHEVVVEDEMPRLRWAAGALLAVLGPFCAVASQGGDVPAPIVILVLGVTAIGLTGAVGVLYWTASPAFRRLAFLAAGMVTAALAPFLVLPLLESRLTPAELAGYLLVVLACAAAGWAVSVLWPVVELQEVEAVTVPEHQDA